MTVAQGHVDPGFERVREIFERQFADGQNDGASVAAYVGDRPVVHLWSGVFERGSDSPWLRDTMAITYSTSKGVTATCLHLLAGRGLIRYDDPVARYWPEFAAAGKEHVTVYHVLTHQSGLSPLPDGLTREDVLDWGRITSLLAAMPPAWTPGEQSGYHALTFGWLVGEIVRRVDGRDLGRFLQEEICRPLDIEDLHIGAPASVEDRIAPFAGEEMDPAAADAARRYFEARGTLAARSLTPGFDMGEVLNSPEGHQAQIPSVNCVATARAIARMYACLANYGQLEGVRLFPEAAVRAMSAQQTQRADQVLVVPIGWALGYMTGGGVITSMGRRKTAFGHPGFGGSVGFADPEIGMSFAFVPNLLTRDFFGTGRAFQLATAVRECIAAV